MMTNKHKIFAAVLTGCLFLMLTGCSAGKNNGKVSISLDGGTYYGEQTVKVESSGGGTIKFTLNGDDPDGSTAMDYNSDNGIVLNYPCTLKVSNGSSTAEATYDVIAYGGDKSAEQQAFYSAAGGVKYETEDGAQGIYLGPTQIILYTGEDEYQTPYYIANPDGNKADVIYTDAEGKNVTLKMVYNPDAGQLTVNDTVYTSIWW